MISISTALSFLAGDGTPVSGGSVTVPDTPYVEPNDPIDPGGGDTGGGNPDPTPAVLPITVTARWHPAFSTTTLDGARIATATDLTGLADASAPTGAGPIAMTDALGRPFWRFEGDSYLEISDALTLSTRAMSVFMVGRFHQIAIRSTVFSLGRSATGTAPNTILASFEAATDKNSVPLLRAYSYPRNASYPTPEKMVTGSQMQVVGMAGRADADGGTTLWMNTDRITAPQPYSVTGVSGAEIGRYAHRPGASGTWGRFDLYEMIVVDNAVTDTDGDALVSDLMTAYGVIPITNQLVLDGDSIMQGTDPVTSGLRADMVLTDPGAGLIGPDWRVVNMASSGAQISKLLDRRDATLGWPAITVTGQNVLAVEIGRNDLSGSGAQNPVQHYANVVGYLTDDFGTSAQSILGYGWTVRAMVNIGSAVSLEPDINAYRALIRDPAFAIDTQTGAGATYARQMQLVNTDQIMVGGATVFADAADASDTTYYAGDSTHPNATGCALRVSGGDTPVNGIAYGF